MIKFILKKNNVSTSPSYGKLYARPVIEETVTLDGLAKHMSQHNSGFSEAMIMGVITAMRKCIKELILDGKNVKIDDLCIFSCGIKNTVGGAPTEEMFSISKNINGVRMRARATGSLSFQSLNLEASLRKASAVTAFEVSNGPGLDDKE